MRRPGLLSQGTISLRILCPGLSPPAPPAPALSCFLFPSFEDFRSGGAVFSSPPPASFGPAILLDAPAKICHSDIQAQKS